jgi:hypothetical protein
MIKKTAALDLRQVQTRPTLCIVESLGFLQEERLSEGNIIARTLTLSGKQSSYVQLRSSNELGSFLKEFGDSKHRYLHMSCHGNDGGFQLTTDYIPAEELAELVAPHVAKRRVFLSSCLAAESTFADVLLKKQRQCYSVVAPVKEIYFDDAAIFRTSFYHLMFKVNPRSMNNSDIQRNVKLCAELIGEKFRFFYSAGNVIQHKTLG